MGFRRALISACLVLVGCHPDDGGGGITHHDAGSPVADAGAPMMAPEITSDAGPPACEPRCDGRACGDDGCGGTCGTCSSSDECVDGACVPSCPDHASFAGDGCYCDSGYIPDASCATCVRDADSDGCPPNSGWDGAQCACDTGYHLDGCACAADPTPTDPPPDEEGCSADELECGGGCIADPDHDGCPAHGHGFLGECFCNTGYRMSDDSCACEPLPPFEHPAFDPASCDGASMTHADAEARWTAGNDVLGSYQMIFRERSCEGSGCGPWVEIPITDIPWATRASGLAQLERVGGVMQVWLHNAWCDDYSIYVSTTYNVGAECSGVGATLTCGAYRYPSVCNDAYTDTEYYEYLGQVLSFSGTVTDSCLQLQANVRNWGTTSWTEAQAAILVSF